MPSQKRTTLTHIQDIMNKRKKVLIITECCHKRVPGWPELSVKECYGMITQGCPEVINYLPDITGKQ